MPSPRPILLSLSLLLFLSAALKVCAQLAPVEDFFNSGAQFYISNNIPAAKERVETGLKMYPDDAKLKKLEELLKQQQQSQNSQSQQSQDKQQSQKSEQQKDQQQKQQPEKNSQDQSKSDEPKPNQPDQQKPASPKPDAGKENKEKPEKPDGEGRMTPEEAKRMLDAQKGNEQVLTLKPPTKPKDPNHPIKDW